MNQYITVWKRNGYLETGEPNFNSPELVRCRYAPSNELIEENKGEQIYAKAIITTDVSFNEGDSVILGDYTSVSDPTSVAVSEVKRQSWVPNARDEYRLYIYHI